jgi:hypothetical protein
VHYLYRDGANYKFRGYFVVAGRIEPGALRPYLFDREYFVPARVGLPSLVPSERTDEDHDLHEFEEFEPTDDEPGSCTAAEFVRRVRRAGLCGWFSSSAALE